MSAFERSPQEIRDMIYKYSLLHEGGIDPHNAGHAPVNINPKAIKENMNESVGYFKEWPSVALLGVNKTIRHEAAIIIFGKNLWTISNPDLHPNSIWETYRSYFRHIAIDFDSRGVSMMPIPNNLLERGGMDDGNEFGCGDRLPCPSHKRNRHTHDLQIAIMRQIWRRSLGPLEGMQLDSLALNIDSLHCPRRCCRIPMIKRLVHDLGSNGPWYQRESDVSQSLRESDTKDDKTKPSTVVKVNGLKNIHEAHLVQNQWGLDIIDRGDLLEWSEWYISYRRGRSYQAVSRKK